MVKDFFLFIKYPYTAGTIGIVWLGSAVLIAIKPELPLIKVVMVNLVVSTLIAAFGFRGKGEA